MKILNKAVTIVFAFLVTFSLSTSAAAERVIDSKDPYKLIEVVADITFKRFANEQDNIRKDANILKTIVREELLPYIDYRYAAFKVIGGQNFRRTTKAERAEFTKVFREYLVTSYAQVFTLYNNQK